MRSLMSFGIALALAGSPACFDQTGSTGRNSTGEGMNRDDMGECVKIEGGEIGQPGVQLQVGDIQVTFVSWMQKADSPGEYVGFELATTSDVVYRVKSGGEVVWDTATVWRNAGGDSGPEAPGISNVEVCDPDPNPDPDGDCNDPDGCNNEPTDPGGDCNDPDGCDNGDGDSGEDPIVL